MSDASDFVVLQEELDQQEESSDAVAVLRSAGAIAGRRRLKLSERPVLDLSNIPIRCS